VRRPGRFVAGLDFLVPAWAPTDVWQRWAAAATLAVLLRRRLLLRLLLILSPRLLLTLSLRPLLLWLLLGVIPLRSLDALWSILPSAVLLRRVRGRVRCPRVRATAPATPAGATRFFLLLTGAFGTSVRRFVWLIGVIRHRFLSILRPGSGAF
jgi:hypothetical protein